MVQMQNLASISSGTTIAAQKMLNGEVHNWYRIVLGYSDHLVKKILKEFVAQPNDRVLDPFCGTGTTLVECMKNCIEAVGIDANPSSYFAARVKTNWHIKGKRLNNFLSQIKDNLIRKLRRTSTIQTDPTYLYLENSGMISRGWISLKPLHKSIAIKSCINELCASKAYKDALMLCLVAEVVENSSNVRFGPELYCSTPKDDSDVFSGFAKRVYTMAQDLDIVFSSDFSDCEIFFGDSRFCEKLLKGKAQAPFNFVICSPPYPAEHDYTRNSRLELAFLEKVSDRQSLRTIKKLMIRSNTKGIYKEDNDSIGVEQHPEIMEIVRKIKQEILTKTHGFAGLYPKVVQEYFGGMKLHFRSIWNLLLPGAKCAYVVGDQESYLRVHIPTAEILSTIANEVGYKTLDIIHWRQRWASATSKNINENILIFQKPF